MISEQGNKLLNQINAQNQFDLELDCEFYNNPLDRENFETLTTQLKNPDIEESGLIFTHNGRKLLNYPQRSHDNPILEYLDYYQILDKEEDNTPIHFDNLIKYGCQNKLIVSVFQFFGIVDFPKSFMGNDRDFLINVVLGQYQNLEIEHTKNLKFRWYRKNRILDYIPFPKEITLIDGSQYQLFIKSMDISAMRGSGSYEDYAKGLGINLPDKGLMDKYKQDMRIPFRDYPELFAKYALGDLHCREIYHAHCQQYKQLCNNLNLREADPKLTVGSSANKIMKFNLELRSGLKLNENNYREYGWERASAEFLRECKNSTAQFLGKVDGGRCNNNKPWIAKTEENIVDIDIKSCYKSTMESLDYPLGNPVILQYPKSPHSSKENQANNYLTLRNFLERYEGELVDGFWFIRVSTKHGYQLKYKQDFLTSWIPPQKIQYMPSDEDKQGSDILYEENEGDSLILTREVNLAVINSDILEIIYNYTSTKARKELLDNLYIISAIFYPKSWRVFSMDEYHDSLENFEEENLAYFDEIEGEVNKNKINHTWISFPLKNLVSKLGKLRDQYPKNNPETKPQNETLKLITNNLYGVSVSPKFKQSNVVLANNVTARARTMAYCMEKGLNMFQTITDGGMFNPEKVINNAERKINTNNLVEISNPTKQKLDYTSINGKSKKEIEKKSIQHLKDLFQNLSIFQNDVFSLEIKEENEEIENPEFIANGASFHGSADYFLNYPNYPKFKMRAFSDDKSFDCNGSTVKNINTFLTKLFENPNKTNRLSPHYESTILKTRDFRNNHEKYQLMGLTLGDSILMTKQILEFSLNQFNFNTYAQWKNWQKLVTKLKENNREEFNINYGQSLEMFYQNKDETLNYEKMIRDIHKDIVGGKFSPSFLESKIKNKNTSKLNYKSHPYKNEKIKYKKIENNL